jgi:hypothetical protein
LFSIECWASHPREVVAKLSNNVRYADAVYPPPSEYGSLILRPTRAQESSEEKAVK